MFILQEELEAKIKMSAGMRATRSRGDCASWALGQECDHVGGRTPPPLQRELRAKGSWEPPPSIGSSFSMLF